MDDAFKYLFIAIAIGACAAASVEIAKKWERVETKRLELKYGKQKEASESDKSSKSPEGSVPVPR